MKSIKKLMSTILALVVASSAFSMNAFAAKTFPVEELKNSVISVQNYDYTDKVDGTSTDNVNGTHGYTMVGNGGVFKTLTGDLALPNHALVASVPGSKANNAPGVYNPLHNSKYDHTHWLGDSNKYSFSFDFCMSSKNTVKYTMYLEDKNKNRQGVDITFDKDSVTATGLTATELEKVAISPDKWYKLSIIGDISEKTLEIIVDNESLGVAKLAEDKSGLVSVGILLYRSANINNENEMYIDTIKLEKIVEGQFYGTAAVNDNDITLTLSETPASLNASDISVKKADGTMVETGEITVSGTTVTIPLTREMATEYVVCLPQNLTSIYGNKIYSSEVFVNSGINTTDELVIIDEDFGDANGKSYVWAVTNKENVIPDNIVMSDQFGTGISGNHPGWYDVTTAYKSADGSVSDTETENTNKVLKVRQTEPGQVALLFEFGRKIVDDWTVEFDFMMPSIPSENGWGLHPTVGNFDDIKYGPYNGETVNGAEYNQNNILYNREVYNKTNVQFESYPKESYPIFGVISGQKLGEPNWSTAKTLELPNTSSVATLTSSYTAGTNQVSVTDGANKWYRVKLEFNRGTHNVAACKATVTAADGTPIEGLNGVSWKLPWLMINSNFAGFEYSGLKIHIPGKGSNLVTLYIDNLKVSTTNMENLVVDTVTVEGCDGNEYGAVSEASDVANKITLSFSGTKTIKGDEITKDNISLKDSAGNDVDFTLGTYNSEDRTISLITDKFLSVGESYTLTAKGIYAVRGTAQWNGNNENRFELLPYKAQINVTETGEFKVIALEIAENKTNMTATIKNTTGEDKTAEFLMASYKENVMTDVAFEKKTIPNGTYTTYSLTTPFAYDPTKSDSAKAFLWDSLTNLKPLIQNASK